MAMWFVLPQARGESPPDWSTFHRFSEGLGQMILGGRTGYIDRAGKVVIQPRFEGANQFLEGLAGVRINGKWGFVDRRGIAVIKPQFEAAGEFTRGVAEVLLAKGEHVFINSSGKILFRADSIRLGGEYEADPILVAVGGRYGYASRKGMWIIPPRFSLGQRFTEGLASVMVGPRWGFIDNHGNLAVPATFCFARSFSEGLACVAAATPEGDKGKYGYIDKKGTWIVSPQYDEAGSFRETLACVKLGGGYGYIDRKGTVVISPTFRQAKSFSEGLAAVDIRRPEKRSRGIFSFRRTIYETVGQEKSYRGQWGYIDRSGKRVIPARFDYADDFHEGRASVVMDAGTPQGGVRYGYIDKMGNYIWKPSR
jgi:hypothetical protein